MNPPALQLTHCEIELGDARGSGMQKFDGNEGQSCIFLIYRTSITNFLGAIRGGGSLERIEKKQEVFRFGGVVHWCTCEDRDRESLICFFIDFGNRYFPQSSSNLGPSVVLEHETNKQIE